MGANVEATALCHTEQQVTPLALACLYEHAEVVELLLEHGADVGKAVGAPWWMLHRLAGLPEGKAAAVLRMLLRQGHVDPNLRDGHGDTPLHTAAFNGRLWHTRELLAAGASVHTRNDAGLSPVNVAQLRLHKAAPSEDTESLQCVVSLLEAERGFEVFSGCAQVRAAQVAPFLHQVRLLLWDSCC
eukprot:TRINITY_DN206_c0_g4_i1.p1 TRINITY_DN206_c0_g4~~TRINITY_DN206_c0_g4_i1.p1  ORF type:complete len:186 (+),score=67.39 TRINITY_DN206_c0_g4_i1:371-928(+)